MTYQSAPNILDSVCLMHTALFNKDEQGFEHRRCQSLLECSSDPLIGLVCRIERRQQSTSTGEGSEFVDRHLKDDIRKISPWQIGIGPGGGNAAAQPAVDVKSLHLIKTMLDATAINVPVPVV